MHTILQHSRKQEITFYASGRIDISSRIVRILSLRAGDSVNLIEDDDGNLLLFRCHDADDSHGIRHKATLYQSSVNARSLRCNSVDLTSHVLSRCGCPIMAKLPVGQTVIVPPFGLCLNIIIMTP